MRLGQHDLQHNILIFTLFFYIIIKYLSILLMINFIEKSDR